MSPVPSSTGGVSISFFQIGNEIFSISRHKLIFQRHYCLCTSRVALACTPPEELPVYAGRFVPFTGDNMKPSQFCYPPTKFNISAAARHVGRHCYPTGLTGTCNDLGLLTVTDGIKYLMSHAGNAGLDHARLRRVRFKQLADVFAVSDTSRANKNRPSGLMNTANL